MLLKSKEVMWLAPTFKQLKHAFLSLHKMVAPLIVKSLSCEYIELQTGGKIHFVTASDPDNLRGKTLNHIVVDEAAFIHEDLIKVISPMLAVKNGGTTFISTPNGHNWFKKEYERVKHKQKSNWYTTVRDWTCSPRLTPEYIKEEKEKMSASDFSQEYCAQFVSPKGSIFPYEQLVNILIPYQTDIPYQRKMLAVDPSLAKNLKSDWQGIVFLGYKDGYFYADAHGERLSTDYLCQKVKDLYEQYKPEAIAWEVNNLQQLGVNALLKLWQIPPVILQVQNKVNKVERISRLSQILSQGKLRIFDTKGGRLLWEQLSDFGTEANHDDLPDALEMAWRSLISAK